MASIGRVGVVGCGLMGSGIAEGCTRAGVEVVVAEASDERVGAGAARIGSSLDRAVGAGKLDEGERAAARFRDRGVVGVGLGGREATVPAARDAEAFAAARGARLGGVPHARGGGGARAGRGGPPGPPPRPGPPGGPPHPSTPLPPGGRCGHCVGRSARPRADRAPFPIPSWPRPSPKGGGT